jgi:hypothetical protein
MCEIAQFYSALFFVDERQCFHGAALTAFGDPLFQQPLV